MTTLLPASLQQALQGIVERANLRGASLRAILLSTTEGVPLGRVVVVDAWTVYGEMGEVEVKALVSWRVMRITTTRNEEQTSLTAIMIAMPSNFLLTEM